MISWLQSPSAMILEPQKIKSDTVSTVSPSISHEVMETDAMIFVKSKTMISSNADENVGQQELSSMVSRNADGSATIEDILAVAHTAEHTPTIQSSNSTP